MSTGTAVLVHGGWSNPDDWRWVAERLERAGITVVAPDLPSHRGQGGRADDVAAVDALVAGAEPPVVAVGWSYGGTVIGELTQTARLTRLLYVAAIPWPMSPVPGDEPPRGDVDFSHILFPDEETCIIDDRWFVEEGDGATFPAEVRAHLRAHPRRPCEISTFVSPPVREAWREVPATILLGRSDDLLPAPLQEWTAAHFDDVQFVDGCHYLPFVRPDAIADAVVAALATPVV
jgi:pimeloyl-ACP methyl ester carboxylesterase